MTDWLAFLGAGTLWGSSFLWIKIALDDVSPYAVVGYRLFFGMMGLLFVMKVRKAKFPKDPRMIRNLVIMGILNPGIPFILLTWGENHIDSGITSVLNGTVPLFTAVIAHLFLADDKISPTRILGLAFGFLGVLMLFSPNGHGFSEGAFIGKLAVTVAVIFYASSAVYSRHHLRNISPVVQAASVMTVGTVFSWIAVLISEIGQPQHSFIPHHWITWAGLLWLGLFGSCLAFLLFFRLLNAWGPARASMVNYLVPVVGLVLGAMFRNEHLDFRIILGTALIVAGVVIVNFKLKRKSKARTA